MKKIVIFLIVLFSLTGCLKRDTMEGIDIYTTVYPLEYITNRLYGNNSNIKSIYHIIKRLQTKILQIMSN